MTAQEADRAIRRHLLWLLRGGNAHASFERAVTGLPARLRGVRPAGLPYSPWMLVEHMRISQWDMLEFSRNPRHVSPAWPDGYWPTDPGPPTPSAWQKSIAAWQRDLRAMQRLVADPRTDLFRRFPYGQGQTVFLEALQIADHNAYHIGQLIVVRRGMGAWKD